jgi:hypothetical protein
MLFKRIRELLSSSSTADSPRAAETSTADSQSSSGDAPLAAPFEVLQVCGAKAPDTWAAMRMRADVVPVLLGQRSAAERMLEVMSCNTHSFESFRDAGLSLDVDEWMSERQREEPERYVIDERRTRPLGQAPAFSPARDIRTNEPLPAVFFGLVPVTAPWLVPAYLKFGGWNDCPDAVVHLAFFHRWFDRYGAVVTTVADDVIEFNVARPPTTPEASRQLALEQYVYCPDIVDQGVETLGNLTGTLQGSPNWYFWWD